jgi:glycopeptide antibiotics resistance protein
MRLKGRMGERGSAKARHRPPSLPLTPFSALLLRLAAWLAVALIVIWLLSMTLRPGSQLNGINLVLFSQKWPALICMLEPSCSEQSAAFSFLFVDVLGNIAVFVPLGAALAVATLPRRLEQQQKTRLNSRWWLTVIAAGSLLSLSIELAQLTIPTRATDVDDVILNTLGTAIGALLIALPIRRSD